MKYLKPILLLIVAGILAANSILAQTKGLKIVPIKAPDGRQVGLYRGSYALVIGVADYTAGWPKLPSVVDETNQIKVALETNGFEVERLLNPNNYRLKAAFEDFINRYGYDRDNRLVFFFSGHGYSRKKGVKGYLVPTNAPDPRTDEKGFLRKALPMSQLLAWSRQMEAKHALFLFDSCFSGTIFKTKALPDVPPHISAVTSRSVRQFIASGDAGEEVPAKSVFAKFFVRGLRGEADLTNDGYVTGSELGMYLRDKVLYYQTGQTPQYGKIRDPDLDEGDFVFTLTPPINILQQQATFAGQPSFDLRKLIFPASWLPRGTKIQEPQSGEELPYGMRTNPYVSNDSSFVEQLTKETFAESINPRFIQEALYGCYREKGEIGIVAFRFENEKQAKDAHKELPRGDYSMVKRNVLVWIWDDGVSDVVRKAFQDFATRQMNTMD